MTEPGVGRLAEEARKLAEAFSTWGRQQAGPLSELGRLYVGPLSELGMHWAAATADQAPPPTAAEDPAAAGTGSTGSAGSAGPTGSAGPRFSDWTHEHGTAAPGGAGECRYCPVCQLIALLRGDRPESTARIVAAGTALLDALRSVVDPPAEPEPPPTVQHIDVE